MAEDIVDLLNRRLELTVLPTEQCNFRCVYCNQRFEIGAMRPETVSALKRFITIRMPELDCLTIQWFGGEPLLAYGTMLDTMRHVQSLKAGNPGVRIASNATTNGYLLAPDRLANLCALGVKGYQITFDGDRDEHDKLRLYRDGHGTFDALWSNMVAAHRTDVDFSITMRLHVNSRNVESMKVLLRRASADIGNDWRFEVFVRFLSRLGGPNDEELPISEDLNAIRELNGLAVSQGMRLSGLDLYGHSDYVCYAAKPFAYVIRSDGGIGKCTVALYDDANSIGRLKRDGMLLLDSEKASRWSRGLFTGNMKELECPLKGMEGAETRSQAAAADRMARTPAKVGV